MRKSKFTEAQIIGILKEAEAARSVGEVARLHGVSRETLYRWRSKYGGMEASDAKRLRALEEENRRLKRIVADQAVNFRS
jgi:putative transposase